MNKNFLFTSFLFLLLLSSACKHEQASQIQQNIQQVSSTQVTKSQWHGFTRYDFTFRGRKSIIVKPETPASGRPWIWRARFFGHEPQTDVALLNKGYFLVYTDVSDWYGAPIAVEQWNAYYKYLTNSFHFNKKVVLEGMSRGGLIIYNWAAANTDKVACMYADAPVCDINSWPGGKGRSKGSESDWKKCLKVYGISEQQAANYSNMPIYNSLKVARAGIAVLHVCGENDQVVPIEENTYKVKQNFKKAGGEFKMIVKAGIGHHPHSLEHPRPIVNFILKHNTPKLQEPPLPRDSLIVINDRGSLKNAAMTFRQTHKGRVAFLGGSITHMKGWRNMVCEYLQQKFPKTDFEFINAGIPSTGSVPGAFRLSRDVLSHGKIDLLFEEAAVNDATNGRTSEQEVRGMEGIIRHARMKNPRMDVMIMYFADPWKLADYNQGKTPEVIQNHEKVARYYRITSLNLAKEVDERILDGQFSWKEDFKNLHPAPFGQKLYFHSIKTALERAWANNRQSTIQPYSVPEKPLDSASYYLGKLHRVTREQAGHGFHWVSDWKPDDNARTREGFVKVPVLEGEQPGSTLNYFFEGNAVGIFITSGPDAGEIEYRIDDKPWHSLDLFTRWSSQLHLPWLYMLGDQLENSRHRLTIRIKNSNYPKSRGHACRIVYFAVNS